MISAVILVLFAPQLARIGLEFQPWDFFMLVIFALTVTASLAGQSHFKPAAPPRASRSILVLTTSPCSLKKRLSCTSWMYLEHTT